MAQKQVTVVINGEEYVSKAAKEAEAGLTGFAGFMARLKDKIVPVVDVTKLAELAVNALSAAFNAAKQFVLDSIDSYDRYVTAQVKLAAQSKLTGVSMQQMNTLVETAREQFGLGTVAAVDITAAVAKFSAAAGDTSQASRLMAAALELGAASGQNAAQVAEGLSSALAGNDEWLNRLGLSNPSVIWEKYADANGIARKEMTDTTKALAVMTEIMDAGNKVTGVYAERMASGAGASEHMTNRLDEAKAAFGAAIQPVRIFVVQGLTALVNVIGPLVVALGYLASGVLNMVVAPFKLAYAGVGSVIEVVGKLTGNTELEKWGKNASQEFVRFTDEMARWVGISKPATEAVEKQGKAHELAAVKITASKDATKAHAETTEQAAIRLNKVLDEKLGQPMAIVIGMTEGAIRRLGEAATQQLPTNQSEKFLGHMQQLAAKAEESRQKMIGTADATERGADKSGKLARDVSDVARSALDAASAFGVVDDNAARTLNSAINIGNALATMATSGFSFAGAVGIIGGVASIVNAMMAGDSERKRLLAKNNEQLDRLRNEIGNLNLNVTGEDLGKAENALAQMMSGWESTSSPVQRIGMIHSFLRSNGLNIEDLKRIAKELGIEIVNSRGEFILSAFPQLLAAIRATEPGQFGQSYLDQLNATTSGFGVRGTNDVGQIAALGNLGGQFSSALRGVVDVNDLAGTRARLAALFERLNAGGVSAAELGGLTGSQFLELITDLIGRIDNLQPGSGSGSGGTVTVPDGTSGGSGGGTTTVPTETIQAVIKAMDTNIAGILTTHTTLHERIAAATESSATSLQSIDAKMDQLIAVSSGTDRIDTGLEAQRFALGVQQGRAVAF